MSDTYEQTTREAFEELLDDHDIDDLEDIPGGMATVQDVTRILKLGDVIDLLDYYNYPTSKEPGWATRNPGYVWQPYKDLPGPHGIMVHHTAAAGYQPKHCYPKPEGWRTDGKTNCNYLVTREGLTALVSGPPGNYTSGQGDEVVLRDYVTNGVKWVGPQSGSYVSEFYGNRYFVNIEVAHAGDGGAMTEDQERAVVALISSICYVYGWDETRVISHAGWRGTKIDPKWDGPWTTPPNTIIGLQDKTAEVLAGNLPPGGEEMWLEDIDDETWMVWFNDTSLPLVGGEGRYYCKNDGTYEFNPAWGTVTSPPDGGAAYSEKINAYNHVMRAYATMLDEVYPG